MIPSPWIPLPRRSRGWRRLLRQWRLCGSVCPIYSGLCGYARDDAGRATLEVASAFSVSGGSLSLASMIVPEAALTTAYRAASTLRLAAVATAAAAAAAAAVTATHGIIISEGLSSTKVHYKKFTATAPGSSWAGPGNCRVEAA